MPSDYSENGSGQGVTRDSLMKDIIRLTDDVLGAVTSSRTRIQARYGTKDNDQYCKVIVGDDIMNRSHGTSGEGADGCMPDDLTRYEIETDVRLMSPPMARTPSHPQPTSSSAADKHPRSESTDSDDQTRSLAAGMRRSGPRSLTADKGEDNTRPRGWRRADVAAGVMAATDSGAKHYTGTREVGWSTAGTAEEEEFDQRAKTRRFTSRDVRHGSSGETSWPITAGKALTRTEFETRGARPKEYLHAFETPLYTTSRRSRSRATDENGMTRRGDQQWRTDAGDATGMRLLDGDALMQDRRRSRRFDDADDDDSENRTPAPKIYP